MNHFKNNSHMIKNSSKASKKGFSTTSVHGGEVREKEHRPLTFPIYQTATYTFGNTQELHDFFQSKVDRGRRIRQIWESNSSRR